MTPHPPHPDPIVSAVLAGLATAVLALPLAGWRWWLAFVPAVGAVIVWGTPAVIPALLAACLAAYIMRRPRPSDRHLLDRHAR